MTTAFGLAGQIGGQLQEHRLVRIAAVAIRRLGAGDEPNAHAKGIAGIDSINLLVQKIDIRGFRFLDEDLYEISAPAEAEIQDLI
jgi:hypothetical protein